MSLGLLIDRVTSSMTWTASWRSARETSIFAFFHRERDALFPDEDFADLFDKKGRNSVPPSVVAVVMALQRLEGLSDREAVERYTFDAAGGTRPVSAATTRGLDELCSHRARRHARAAAALGPPEPDLRRCARAAKQAGLIGRRRVLDSTRCMTRWPRWTRSR